VGGERVIVAELEDRRGEIAGRGAQLAEVAGEAPLADF
jgi:hypothetical protein